MHTKSGIIKLASWLLVIFMAAVALSSCLGKKNTAAKRNYSAFITRYNIYFNGEEHYNTTLDKMERDYEDDYSRQVLMHPIDAKAEATLPQPSGNFDRSIEKAQKAIQLRSIKNKPQKKGSRNDPKTKAWMSREEYNPFLHNAWMMMGRSQYYNGDFLGAASTFFYISRHFKWLPKTVTEAKLWQAISYLSMGWNYDADIILVKIKDSELVNDTLKKLYNYARADYLLRAGEYEASLPFLKNAVDYSSGAQKTRLRFLYGQILARTGHKKEAYEAFKKAGGSSSATYRTKFNARIKQSEVYDGADIKPEVNALKRMTRYDRNKEYLDQIYYAIGNLYLSRKDTAKAIENYELAAKKSTRNGIDKALSQLTLGGLYFGRREYVKAQVCYSEAVPQLPETFPDYKEIKKRSDVLDELATYAQNVKLQDSLLALAAMPEADRLKVVDRIIEELKKKEAEEKRDREREEFLSEQQSKGDEFNQNNNNQAPKTFNLNTDNSWYFYNQSVRNSGRSAFQRRWGARKNEDDWRRRNKTSFSTGDDSDSSSGDEQTEEGAEGAAENTEENDSVKNAENALNDPHNPAFYLKDIPLTDEQKKASHDIIQEGLYNMGLILKDKLDDMPAAMTQWERLLKDYPDNTYRLDTYYNIYLMASRHGDTALAEKYRWLILSDFPESIYGEALKDPHYLDNLRNIDSETEALYEKTYEAYLANDNEGVHRNFKTVADKYPTARIMPKFMFLNALAYVPEKEPEKFREGIKSLLERYPDTDLTPIASAWLEGLNKGRKLQTDGKTNLRGMIWDIRLGNDSLPANDENAPKFELNPDSPQYVVLLFPTDKVSSNQLLYDIARFNFKSFVVKDFDLEQLNFGRLGMLIVKGFDNMPEVEHYIRTMAADGEIKLPAEVRPVIISAANFKVMLDTGSSFEQYFNFLDSANYEYAQEGLVPKEEIETLEEADRKEMPIVTEENLEEAEKAEKTEKSEPSESTEPSQPQKSVETVKAKEPEKGAKEKVADNATDQKKVQEPAKKTPAKKAPAPKPKKKQKKKIPDYEKGSEGEDELLKN